MLTLTLKGIFIKYKKRLFGENQMKSVWFVCVSVVWSSKLCAELWVCHLQVIQVFSNHVLSVFLSRDSFPL